MKRIRELESFDLPELKKAKKSIVVQAERHLAVPNKLYVTGRCKSGKTTTTVGIIDRIYRPQIDRLVVCCPSFWVQDTFLPIRNMVKDPDRDVLNVDETDPFKNFFKKLKIQKTKSEQLGIKNPQTLLFIDDMGGQKSLQARYGSLAQLSLQSSHWNCSIIIICQYPKLTIAPFRQNCDAYICFPPTSSAGRDWLHDELNSNHMSKEGFNKLIDKAWRGKRKDFDELNQHFLFVVIQSRNKALYFVDFTHELKSTPAAEVKHG